MPLNSFYPDSPEIIITENEPLNRFSTLGTGGTAEFFAQPESISQLQELVTVTRNNIPVYVIGGGSNIIIPDGTIHGLTISTRKLDSITWIDDSSAEIESGCILSHLVKILREKNIGGLEFSAGIPGTIGGAVSGNAGAGGHGVCEFIECVKAVDSSGDLVTFRRGEFEYGYRRCSLSGVITASVIMSFRDCPLWNEESYSGFMLKRKSQPLGFRSAGCTFKNPEGHSAGKLLDECGCKGLRAGDAAVSEKHANFIINCGNASSSDVLRLAEICSEKVYDCTGIKLEPEIKTLTPCFSVT